MTRNTIGLPNQSPRILITRLSAVGDCIHTMPLVAAIRKAYPSALIGWATQPGIAPLIEGLAGLDEVIVVDRRWMNGLKSIRQARVKLRSFDFDISIDPQSLTKSSMLGWLAGAPRRIGFARGQARELSPLLNTTRVQPTAQHVVDRYLELLSAIGINQPNVCFNVPSHRRAQGAMEGFVAAHGSPRFALLNPGAGWPSKIWPLERYAAVGRYLVNRYDMPPIVLWSGDVEHRWAKQIAGQIGDRAILAPATTLPELASLCRLAKLFVGSDTGPLHLAAAVGTPCVAMYGPTRSEVCGPYGDGHETLQGLVSSGHKMRASDNRAMHTIGVDAVCKACDSIQSRCTEPQRNLEKRRAS